MGLLNCLALHVNGEDSAVFNELSFEFSDWNGKP
jgi:hypothetical protein